QAAYPSRRQAFTAPSGEVTAGAFVGTDPTGEQITSGLPVPGRNQDGHQMAPDGQILSECNRLISPTTRLLGGECSQFRRVASRAVIPIGSMACHLQLNTKFVLHFAIQSTRGLKERCAYESGPHGDCPNHADCAGRHPGRCVSDSRGDGISSVFAGQEGELDGSLCAARSCGSTALADSGNSGCLGTVGGGEGTRPGGRAPCGSRSRPGVLAVTEA